MRSGVATSWAVTVYRRLPRPVAGAQAVSAFQHQAIARFEALLHHAELTSLGPTLNWRQLHLVFFVHNIGEGATGAELQRGGGHQRDVLQGFHPQANVDELIGEELLFGIGEARLEFDRAGGGVDKVVEAFQLAFGQLSFSLRSQASTAKVCRYAFVAHTAGSSASGRVNITAMGRVWDDYQWQVSPEQPPVTDIRLTHTQAAADRCAHLSEIEVKPRGGDIRLQALEVAAVLVNQRFLGVERLLGY